MTAGLHESTITVPGACHWWPIIPAPADREFVTTDAEGQHQDGNLLLGTTLTGREVVLHCDTAEQWRAVALAASRLADWRESA